MANNIQLKLSQKKNKIDQLKVKLSNVESSLEDIQKVFKKLNMF